MTTSQNSRTAPPRFDPQPFRPPLWLRGPHAQTIAGKFLRPRPRVKLRRERVDTPDGDFVDLDFGPTPDHPLGAVLVLHGLEGSTSRGYIQTTFEAVLRRGLQPIGLNFRSCSGEPNRTPRLYHSGETEDLRHVLRLLEQRVEVPIGVIGYSLGGNVLLKYLGEEGDAAGDRLRAAVAVSVPYDLSAGSRTIERGPMGRIYTEYFMRNLRRKAAAKVAGGMMGDECDVAAVLAARTLREFDDAATAPLHGFEDAEDYYRRSSSAAFLEHIRVPTLLLHAEDDPFLPARFLPRPAIDANPWITPAFVAGGGHVGFISGSPWRPCFWAESEAARFLETMLGGAAARGMPRRATRPY